MNAMLEDEVGLSMHVADVDLLADNFKRARSHSCT